MTAQGGLVADEERTRLDFLCKINIKITHVWDGETGVRGGDGER